MKTPTSLILFLALTAPCVHAQVPNSSAAAVPPPTPCQIVDIGPNHQVWRWQTFELMPNGQTAPHTHSYTELASGLNYKDRTTGQWLPSQNKIEAFAGGGIVRQCQHQIIFANNLNSAGAIDMQSEDGTRLRSNILGLMYFSPTTGQAIQIAGVQDSEGELIANNEALYPNALEGVNVDVLYKNRLDGLEQDLIIKAQLPAPASVGMISEDVELEVFTEFLSPPAASVADLATDSQGMEPDQAVSWGATHLGQGKAFIFLGEDTPVTVVKRYVAIGGRYFLLEKVRLQDIQKALSQLPEQASNARRLPGVASTHFKFPQGPALKSVARPMRIALGTRRDKGYVLDYICLNTAYTNYTFHGDTTYYVSTTLNLAGTNTYEGGTVIKYATNASTTAVVGSKMVFLAAPFHPVVFTAKDDNTVGETISGSTGSPNGFYANPALNLSSMGAVVLAELRICYASKGLSVSGASPAIYDAQFVHCATAISDLNGAVTLENALFSNIKTNFNASSSTNTINVQNATFNNVFDLIDGTFANTLCYVTNCVFVNVTNLSGGISAAYNGFYRAPPVGTQAVSNTYYPLQSAGAASCYLTNGCVYRTNGTTAADPYGLSLIKLKTTQAPLVYSNLTFLLATNFGPQVAGDTNTVPEPGYHYDRLDYAFSGVNAYSNVTFSAGTAVGWFELPGSGGPGYGISTFDNVRLSFIGTASQPCTLARYDTVQEGGNGLWEDKGYLGGIAAQSLSGGYSMNPTNAARAMVTFTRHYGLANDPNHYRELNALSQVFAQNSEFYTGYIGAYWDNLYCTNCLFDRVGLTVAGSNLAQYWLRNCVMHGGSVSLSKYGQTWPVWIEECAFDGTTLSVDDNSGGNTNITYCNFNAFLTNANRLPMCGTHDVTNLVSYYWQSSGFGNYYQRTNSPLMDHGSTTADNFGLFHFTTQTNQMAETNSIVDIGYHYVATDANGNPIDTNGDGISDYLEDANGDGMYDTGDLGNWLISPYNGLSSANVLSVFTPLK